MARDMQVHWWVGPIPGYLNEDRVKIEVLQALSQWQGVAPLTFQQARGGSVCVCVCVCVFVRYTAGDQ